ncbi:MarR family transcriptional regulator [Candidatus Marinimicrobia bacterium MT.SAG.3]|nr:MarR family transcriptional regulator [Candidatus Marinimicrobia bacterium MT.SAG.3]TFB12580.1 MarR family transcriptional regulator [Candidatus Marinimicrobia bacterium MT.SAG.4]
MKKQKENIDSRHLPDCACFNLQKATRAVSQYYSKILKPSGLRGTQFTILRVLAVINSGNITNIANIMVVDRTTLTRNLRPLEKRKLVKIVPGKDQRSKEVRLTKKGKDTLTAAIPLWEEAQKRFSEKLSKEEFQNIFKLMSSIISVVKA